MMVSMCINYLDNSAFADVAKELTRRESTEQRNDFYPTKRSPRWYRDRKKPPKPRGDATRFHPDPLRHASAAAAQTPGAPAPASAQSPARARPQSPALARPVP